MRYRMSGSEMIFDYGDAEISGQSEPEITALRTFDGGLNWRAPTSFSSQALPGVEWQTVWTITTEADFEGFPLQIMIASGLPELSGAWLQKCQRFIEQLPAILPVMAESIASERASKNYKSLQYLLEDMKLELATDHWSSLFPDQSQPDMIGGADLNSALKVTGLSFTATDVPRDYSSTEPNTVVVDFRFLCPASEAADIVDDEAYLKFGSWVDVTGQVIAVNVKFDGQVIKLQLES